MPDINLKRAKPDAHIERAKIKSDWGLKHAFGVDHNLGEPELTNHRADRAVNPVAEIGMTLGLDPHRISVQGYLIESQFFLFPVVT